MAAAAAITIPASAQVYSANIVGYVNYTQAAGTFDISANPLSNGDNSVSTVFANPVSGLQIYKQNATGTGYDIAVYDPDEGGWTSALSLPPGVGFWVFAPAGASAYSTTFVGEVVQNSTNALPAGFSLKSSIFPQAGKLQTDLGMPAVAGDQVYMYNGAGYSTFIIDPDEGGWAPSEPSVKVAQGFWFYTPTAKSWTKNYTPQ